MRLAVRLDADGRSLWVLGPAGWSAVGPVAIQKGWDLVAAARDVGELYRCGDEAVALVRALAAEPPPPGIGPPESVLAPPVTLPSSFVCVGRNYIEHIVEGQADIPVKPLLFAKFANTLIGHRAGVIHHAITRQLDYEGELAVIIGKRTRRVSRADAMRHVAGYTILNDITGRDLQYEDLQWIRGKSLDTWCPLGPVFVTADEVPDPYALRIRTTVNGEVRQDASVGDMIFKIDELIEFISQGITLEPGDLLATGTPAGVGLGFDPPRWLCPDDVVEVTIDPIGTLTSTIVAVS
jgi:2-keto-4-pentenoate hydratase/2-oxohepta-3-ene-1,7-dioic acid hydratase in catechol pathway